MKNTINFHLISKSTGQFQLMQHKFIVLNFHFTNVSGMNAVQLSYGKMFKNCVELAHFDYIT